jgi:hypothetical protein
MTPSEITETLSLIVYVGSFATLVYAVYVAISIYKMNKVIYDDHREYKRALFADAMRSYHTTEFDDLIPNGMLEWSLEEMNQYLKDNKAAFREAFKKKYPNIKF